MNRSVRYQVMPPLSPDEYQELHDDISRIGNLDGFKPLDKTEIDWMIDQESDKGIARARIINAMWRDAHPGWRAPVKSGFVYFIEAPSAGVIKIGYAAHPESRMKAIGGMSPVSLRLLAATPGGISDEKNLHRKFSHLRSHGEWFHFTNEIEEYIGGIK